MKNYLVLVMLKKNENIDYKMALAEVIIKTFIKNEGENMIRFATESSPLTQLILGLLQDEDDAEGWNDELSADSLAIRNYIENRHAEGINPTVKQVQSRMKGVALSTQDIIEIVEDLGFYVENIDGAQTGRSEISLNF
jgi:hypothetical protein